MEDLLKQILEEMKLQTTILVALRKGNEDLMELAMRRATVPPDAVKAINEALTALQGTPFGGIMKRAAEDAGVIDRTPPKPGEVKHGR